MIVASRVVLPTPLRPIMDTVSLGASARRMSSSTTVSPWPARTLSSSSTRSAMMASAMAFLAKINRPHLFVIHDFGGCTLGEDRTLHQHGDLFCKAEHDVHIVLDDENSDVRIERRNHIENEMAFGRRHTRGRFFQEGTRGFCASAIAISTSR